MKKILIFSVAYEPFLGGAEIAVKNITDRISPTEIAFDMITVNLDGKQKAEEKIGNIMVYRVGGGGFGKIFFPFLSYAKAKKLDKIHSYDCAWAIMASWASIAAAFFKRHDPRKKLVLTLQEGDEESHLERYVLGLKPLYKIFIRPWYRLAFKNADRITVISSYLRDRALAEGVKVPVDIIPNGVDTMLFSQPPAQQEAENLKRKLGKKPEDVFLITTSRLVEKNAVADIVNSLTHLPENFKLLIVGIGPDEKMLKQLADKKNFSDRVSFLGFIAHEKIPLYLSVSDVFARPSISEGFGNSFIEAMAAGIPVVATPVGGIVDFLYDSEKNPTVPPTGLFSEVHDPKSIAEKVMVLENQPALRETIVKNAKSLVLERYDWGGIARKMKVVLES